MKLFQKFQCFFGHNLKTLSRSLWIIETQCQKCSKKFIGMPMIHSSFQELKPKNSEIVKKYLGIE